MKRDLIAVTWSLLVTGAISKWAFHVAYLERGYKAVGGEYLVILVAYVAAWKAINYLFDSLEELESERNRRKKRSTHIAKGKAHPWHLEHTDSKSRVFGWVDDGTFS